MKKRFRGAGSSSGTEDMPVVVCKERGRERRSERGREQRREGEKE